MDTKLKQEAAAGDQQHDPGGKQAASEKIRRSPDFTGGRRFYVQLLIFGILLIFYII